MIITATNIARPMISEDDPLGPDPPRAHKDAGIGAALRRSLEAM
jgi:hypothetical protein